MPRSRETEQLAPKKMSFFGKKSTNTLTPTEIDAFRNHRLMKSFYKFIQVNKLRKKALIMIHHELSQKSEVANYEDL